MKLGTFGLDEARENIRIITSVSRNAQYVDDRRKGMSIANEIYTVDLVL